MDTSTPRERFAMGWQNMDVSHPRVKWEIALITPIRSNAVADTWYSHFNREAIGDRITKDLLELEARLKAYMNGFYIVAT